MDHFSRRRGYNRPERVLGFAGSPDRGARRDDRPPADRGPGNGADERPNGRPDDRPDERRYADEGGAADGSGYPE